MTKLAELSGPSGALQKRIPDFFIVGHPKSGTTALYEILRRHPQIHMPIKEPSYFGPDVSPRWPSTSAARQDPLEEYVSLFAAAGPEQRIGEATPSYLRSDTAARRIAELQPDARIIAILREPASFVRSLHLEFVQSHMETEKDLRRALALEQERRLGRHIPHAYLPQTFLYADRIRYVEQLRRYHDVFPADQVLVLIYDDFRRDNASIVRQVLRFLEVDASSPVEAIEANPTVRLRSRQLNDGLQAVVLGAGPAARALNRTITAVTPRKLRKTLLRTTRRQLLYAKPEVPDEELMRELRGRFKGEVVALSEYLDRDLVTLWGYASIA
jgi:hypothetical protein